MQARILDQILEWREEDNKRIAVERQAERLKEYLVKLPKRFRGKSFADYCVDYPQQSRIKSIAEKFVSTMSKRLEEGMVLQFHGQPGTGKTFLSLIMIQALIQQGFTTHYESSLAFVKELLEKRYDSAASYRAAIEYYSRVQFLVLDEITESVSKDGRPSALEMRVLHDVINARYEAENRCTLIISNRDPSQLSERLGTSIADRLMQNSITLIFDWKSYRV